LATFGLPFITARNKHGTNANCKKWFELKTRMGKNCKIDKLKSEGRPNISGTQAALKLELPWS
jgi:hypothetical protein